MLRAADDLPSPENKVFFSKQRLDDYLKTPGQQV
jgi:hypothetical protein